MARLRFADFCSYDNGTTLVVTNSYTVCINPIVRQDDGLANVEEKQKLGGPSTFLYGSLQNELRVWEWRDLPSTQKYLDLVNELRGYRGKYKMMCVGSAGTELANEWIPILVIDVLVKYRTAPGLRPHIDSLRLEYVVVRDWMYTYS